MPMPGMPGMPPGGMPGGMPGMPGGKPPGVPQTPGGPMPGKPPVLPGSPMGGPGGPGGSPMTSPGGGAGNEAAADAKVKAALQTLHTALAAYPIGDEKYKSVVNAIRTLSANFGKDNQKALVPAAIQQMGADAKAAQPRQPMPPPGIRPAPGPGPAMPDPMEQIGAQEP